MVVLEVEVGESLDRHQRRVVVRGGVRENVLERGYYYWDAQAGYLGDVVFD